jgi:ABC-type multidrug transport system fused ATPase/permease subunit
MYDPDDGSVMVDGINVKRLLLHSLRSNMGVVAQETVLFHASLRRNIMYGKDDATEDEVWEAVRISALETLVKSLPEGLDTVVGERGMKLSGGERQRVG